MVFLNNFKLTKSNLIFLCSPPFWLPATYPMSKVSIRFTKKSGLHVWKYNFFNYLCLSNVSCQFERKILIIWSTKYEKSRPGKRALYSIRRKTAEPKESSVFKSACNTAKYRPYQNMRKIGWVNGPFLYGFCRCI